MPSQTHNRGDTYLDYGLLVLKRLVVLLTLLLLPTTAGFAQIDNPQQDHLKPKMRTPARSLVVDVPLQGCVDLVAWRETGIATFPNNPGLVWVEVRHPWDETSFAYLIRNNGNLREVHCYTEERCWFGSMAPVEGRPRMLYTGFPCNQVRSMITFFNNIRIQQQQKAEAQKTKPLDASQ